ncbi:MAG TPA: RNA polymerase sigma factor [Deltaproteobacteria bacterium]|nr:RNA polymerase sigma factor [Deltaproteobacteria bacterium]
MIFSFQKRSKKQFQQLTDPYIQLMYNMALRYCGNSFDAEDILQEAMYIAFKNRHQLKDETKCKAWLLTILRRLYLKEIRQNTNRPITVEDISCLPLMEAQVVNDHTLTFEKKEKAVIVRRCLSELPENYQTPTLLYFMDDMSYQEIAETLDMPIGTVMSRLSRAKQLLKKKLLQQSAQSRSGHIVSLYPQSHLRKANTNRGLS